MFIHLLFYFGASDFKNMYISRVWEHQSSSEMSCTVQEIKFEFVLPFKHGCWVLSFASPLTVSMYTYQKAVAR